MSDTYTVEACRALLASAEGREELEAAIGRACGLWNTRYYLHGLPGEFDYGGYCLEMIGALPRKEWGGELTLTDWAFAQRGEEWEVWSQPHRMPANIFAATLAEALFLALAAAGLLKKGASDGS